MQLTFRIDSREGVTADKVKEFFEKYSDVFEKFLIYEEIADKTKKLHWQGIIYTESTIGSIREKVRRFFPDMVKGEYSWAKVKTENYEVYVTKDKNRLCSKGYTDEEISALEDKSYKKVENKKENFIEQLEKAFLEWHAPEEEVDPLDEFKEVHHITRYELIEWVYDYLSAHGKWQMCNSHQVASIHNYLRLKYPAYFEHYDKMFKSTLIEATMRKIFS